MPPHKCASCHQSHRPSHRDDLHALRTAVDQLLELQRRQHPAEAADIDRWAELRAKVDSCCPDDAPCEEHEVACGCCGCCGCVGHGRSHGGREIDGDDLQDGWSVKSRARVDLVDTGRSHRPWKIADKPHHEDDEDLAPVGQGSIFGRLDPVTATASPLDFRSGSAPSPGSQGPVVFRTFTDDGFSGTWPPDCSGAKAGDVVLMSGNLWLKLSVDGGQSFTDLDFTKLFAADTTYGGWAGDQVIHYVPEIDCFVLYVQSYKVKSGAKKSQNVVKIALASPADLKANKGGKAAWWRQWDFTSDTFGLGAAWMDFPDVSFGGKYLHVNTNVFDAISGKLFFELPLADMAAGRGLNFLFAVVEPGFTVGSPIQNIAGDTNYFAGHVDNSTMRIFTSTAGDANYSWRDRKISNWPKTSDNDIVEAAPDWSDWISEDHRIIGATRQGNLLWFAWAAGKGNGGGGGFSFPRAHVQIAKFDLSQDYKLVEQTQVWNPDFAFAYPCLTTNSDDEVGISLGWGGGASYGSHAVGILGDFVVWFGDASDMTSLRQLQDDTGAGLTNPDGTPKMYSRWGDYVHVRLAHPDTRWFSGFGYAVNKTSTGSESLDALYVEFGREVPGNAPAPGLH